MRSFIQFLQRFITDTHVFFTLKVTCALAVLLLPGIYLGMVKETVAMSLGLVAGAIAEPDDSWLGRFKSLLLTLICFWIATLSVQLLYPYPWIFAFGLFASTWFFVMLGSLGKRYATISFGSLLVAVYSMMGAAQAPDIWFQPVWLCTGALWYGFVSLCWFRFTPNKPLREQLSQTCFALGRYCTQKAFLFPSNADEQTEIHQRLAILNIDCITSISLCQEMLNRRQNSFGTDELHTLRALHILTEQIHERITSSHYLYNRLKEDVHRHLVLDGFREVMRQLGTAIQQLGYNVLMNKPSQLPPGLAWSIQALSDQLQLSDEKIPFSAHTINALQYLQRNLQRVVDMLSNVDEVIKHPNEQPHSVCAAPASLTLPEAILKIRQHLSLKSPLFRHGCRMSCILVIGYLILETFAMKQGFWIVLTCLFVCQSSYTATRRRLVQRILGTCSGLLLSSPLLWLAPSPSIQLILMAIAAILFFGQVRSNYSLAVVFITLYAMTAFGLLGVAEENIMLPRFIDTLIGSALSFAAVSLMWPEWQYQRIPELLSRAVHANKQYLQALIASLQAPAHTEPYDQKRIAAHAADSALAQAWMNMQSDPKEQRRYTHLCAALIYRNHSLLSYVSALGIHSDLHGSLLDNKLVHYAEDVFQALDEAAQALQGQKINTPFALTTIDKNQLQPWTCPDHRQGIIQQEMRYIGIMTSEILKLSRLLRPLIQTRHRN